MRSAAVLVFIAVVAAIALYCAQRPTVARGRVLAGSLVESNPMLAALDCDPEVPIGVTGATFRCKAIFKNGDEAAYHFHLDRAGMIQVVDQGDARSAPRIKKTTDPWGD
jgi:hypothetical protein